jgi:hypothetical protein
LGSLGLGNWSPEAGGTGWLTLGEPGGTGSPDRVFEILSKNPSSEPSYFRIGHSPRHVNPIQTSKQTNKHTNKQQLPFTCTYGFFVTSDSDTQCKQSQARLHAFSQTAHMHGVMPCSSACTIVTSVALEVRAGCLQLWQWYFLPLG